jgi:hypothetical protein
VLRLESDPTKLSMNAGLDSNEFEAESGGLEPAVVRERLDLREDLVGASVLDELGVPTLLAENPGSAPNGVTDTRSIIIGRLSA